MIKEARDAAAKKAILADLKADHPGQWGLGGNGPDAKAEAGKASAGYDGAVLNNNKPDSKAGR